MDMCCGIEIIDSSPPPLHTHNINNNSSNNNNTDNNNNNRISGHATHQLLHVLRGEPPLRRRGRTRIS